MARCIKCGRRIDGGIGADEICQKCWDKHKHHVTIGVTYHKHQWFCQCGARGLRTTHAQAVMGGRFHEWKHNRSS